MNTATRIPIPWATVGIGGLALILLAGGIFLRPEAMIAFLAGPSPRNAEPLRLGAQLFKICLFVDAVLLLGWVVRRVRASRREGRRPPAQPRPSRAPGISLFAGPPPDGLSRATATAVLCLLLAAGAVLRALSLSSDLWLDEIGSLISYIRFPFGRIITSYTTANQHLFYSLLSHASLVIFGENPAAVRLPAVLFGVAGIWGVYRLARLTESRTDALLVSAIMTVSYHHIFFSQNARGYTLFLFLALIGTVLFVRGLATNRPLIWAAYLAVTVLNMYNHLNAVFIFLGQIGTYMLMFLLRPTPWKTHWPMLNRVIAVSLLTGFLTFHLYAWVIPEMLTFYATADRVGVGWSLLSADFFKEFAKGLRIGFSSGVAVIGVIGICAYGSIHYLRQNFWAGVLFALPSVLGILAVWVLRVGTYPRFFLFALPIALIMLVRGARALGDVITVHFRSRAAAAVWMGLIMAGAIGVSARSLVLYYRIPKQDFRGALAFIRSTSDADAPIIGADMAAICAQYYDPFVKAANQPSEIEPLLRRGEPVWLLYIFPASIKLRLPALYDYIDEHFTVVQEFPGTVGDGTVYVCRNRAAKP